MVPIVGLGRLSILPGSWKILDPQFLRPNLKMCLLDDDTPTLWDRLNKSGPCLTDGVSTYFHAAICPQRKTGQSKQTQIHCSSPRQTCSNVRRVRETCV